MKESAKTIPIHHLPLRVREIEQLFNSMDPTPFLNKDLDPAAEAFIESWASGFPACSCFHLTIHLEKWPAEEARVEMLTRAIHNHFSYKTELARNALKSFLRQGRISLVIGIGFVSICLLIADTIGKLGAQSVHYNIARESLTIVGWVAMWRPLQIFLYDWWPLQKKIRLYENLSNAQVKVIQGR
jgi:hypothetical protein